MVFSRENEDWKYSELSNQQAKPQKEATAKVTSDSNYGQQLQTSPHYDQKSSMTHEQLKTSLAYKWPEMSNPD